MISINLDWWVVLPIAVLFYAGGTLYSKYRHTYWFVSYTLATEKDSGFGHTTIRMKGDTFYITEVTNHLKATNKAKYLTLLTWQEISKKQYVEDGNGNE
jgi:hypothetical protein